MQILTVVFFSTCIAYSLGPLGRLGRSLAPQALFFLLQLIFFRSSFLGFGSIMWTLFLLFVEYFCYNRIMAARAISITGQVPYEYYLDVYALTLAVQLLSLYTDSASYLFIAVPLFMVYKGGVWIYNYVFTPDEEPTMEESAAAQKAAAKRERKANRVQYR